MADGIPVHASGEGSSHSGEGSSHSGPGPKKPCRVCSDFKGWAKKQSSKPSVGKENADVGQGQGQQQPKGDTSAGVEASTGVVRVV